MININKGTGVGECVKLSQFSHASLCFRTTNLLCAKKVRRNGDSDDNCSWCFERNYYDIGFILLLIAIAIT